MKTQTKNFYIKQNCSIRTKFGPNRTKNITKGKKKCLGLKIAACVAFYNCSFKGLFYKTKYRFEWSLIAFFAVIDKESFVVAKDIDNCQGKFSGFLNRMISY